MIGICRVGSKRGYTTIQSKERIVLMETKSPASTSGASTLELDRIPEASSQGFHGPTEGMERLVTLTVPADLENFEIPTEHEDHFPPVLIDVKIGQGLKPTLTHESATTAYAIYKTHAVEIGKIPYSYPQWLRMASQALPTRLSKEGLEF
jgi:hypothetical protein